MAVGVCVDLRDLAKGDRLLKRIRDYDREGLLQLVGALVESQTRRRIEFEKTSPEGVPWAAWSPSYAATRTGNQSLLQAGGQFLDSITHNVNRASVTVGSPLVQARILQEGGTTRPHEIRPRNKKALRIPGGAHPLKVVKHPGSKFPPRPYLGVSDENADEIRADAYDWFESLVQS